MGIAVEPPANPQITVADIEREFVLGAWGALPALGVPCLGSRM